MRNEQDPLPLDGVTIVDFSRLLPGPSCTQMLGDMGADVIKIEQPGTGDYSRYNPPTYKEGGVYFHSVNRNKRSLALDLSIPMGKEAARRLIERADVVIESFRPGVTAKWGIDYATLSEHHPELIYCSISGFGQQGSWAGVPAHDLAIVGLSGFMGVSMESSHQLPLPGFEAGDYAGAANACMGILGAVLQRQKTGRGCHIDISLFDSLLAWASIPLSGALSRHAGHSGEPAMQVWGGNPRYTSYATRDGKAVTVCLLEARTWRRFCQVIERPDLIDANESWKDRHSDHGERAELYRRAIEDLCRNHDRDDLVARMMEADVPFCPIYAPDEVIKAEIVIERDLIETIDDPVEGPMPQLANPLRGSGLVDTKRRSAPTLGQHSVEILTALGYSEADQAVITGQTKAKE